MNRTAQQRGTIPGSRSIDRHLHHTSNPLADAFRHQARLHAKSIAVSHGTSRITYRELDQAAQDLATRLHRLGVRPGHRVAVSLDRSIGFVVAQLGILSARAVCVPLDPQLPERRRTQLLTDTGAWIVIGDHAISPLRNSPVLWLDISNPGTDPHPQECTAPANSPPPPPDTAFILYTSGSTGVPKGVCIRHQSVIHLVCDTDYVEFRPDDVVMNGAHVSFDAMLFEVWGALLHGSRVEVVDKEILLQPDALGALLGSRAVSVAFLTTSLFNITALTLPHIFGRLRHLVVGGEAANAECMRRVLQSGSPPLRLINGYGPTEATTFSTWFLVEAVPPDARTLPIGRPIRRASVHILDPQLRPVAPGEDGEIYIGGMGVAAGYWLRPDLTAERFLPDHFLPSGAGLLYRTGDLARMRPDGNIDFLGRMDHQVKIRGNRIEVGEIEALLQEHPEVLECAVIADASEGIVRRLVAFVVPRSSSPPMDNSPEQPVPGWMPWLRDRLPAYMVPAKHVLRSSLPRTSTGKIDRQMLASELGRLQETERHAPSPEADHTMSSTENRVCAIGRELLGMEHIDPTASFFELGGDSLMAVQMFLRVQQQTGVLVPLENWLQSPSLRTLSHEVDRLLNRTTPVHSTAGASTPGTTPQILLIGWLLNLSSNDVGGLPCYVLPFPEGGHSPSTCSVEHLASGCLAAMNSIGSPGPRILVGYSLGGLVAIEMARRMESVGTPPAEVWLIDSIPASWPHRLGPALARLAGSLGVHSFRRQLLIGRAIHSLAEMAMPLFQGRFREWIRRTRHELRRFRRRRMGTLPASSTLSAPENHHPHVWANNAYQPKPYSGRVRLFITQPTTEDAPSPGHGWSPALSQLEVVVIQGNHFTCIQEDRESLVRSIEHRLDQLHALVRSNRS